MAGVKGLELPVILSEGDLRPEALVYALRRACRIVGAADAQRMADALETGGALKGLWPRGLGTGPAPSVPG